MPKTTYLHIQSRDAMPTRVVELRGTSVRIGRGAQCEVRLGEPALAEVQCLLRRRGETWHVQPVGPNGRVSIDGRPVDQQSPLPPGVALRVGDHWLRLRPAGSEPNDEFGPFAAPVLLEVPAPPDPAPGRGCEPTTAAPHDGFRPAGDGLEAERERLSRWQARLQQRGRWLKERPEE